MSNPDLREIPVEIPADRLDDPDIQRQVAFLRGCAYFYERDPVNREHVAVHEAAHKIYFMRLGWNVRFGGPKIIVENGWPVLTMGCVVLTGVTDADVDKQDQIAVAKAHIAPSIVVLRLTGRPEWTEAIAGDRNALQACLRIGDATLASLVERAALSVSEDLSDESFRQAIWDSASEFHSSEQLSARD